MKDTEQKSAWNDESDETRSTPEDHELDETDLENVAGGITWHWTPENEARINKWDDEAA